MNKKISNIVERIISAYIKILLIIIKDKKTLQNMYAMSMCEGLESITDKFVSYRIRPKYTQNVDTLFKRDYSEMAIVIQGPLKKEDNFTYETVRMYRKVFNSATIIVSTWDSEDAEVIRKIASTGAIIVQSTPPEISGFLMINYQLRNTIAGIKLAKQKNIKYVLKTRTDQRIYNVSSLAHLKNLLSTFPCNNNDFAIPQKERIVCCCMEYGDMFYPYCLSDFIYFGTIEEMEILFSINEDERDKGAYADNKSKKYISENMLAPEVMLLRYYIQSHGGNDECTVKAYWEFVKNHLITINKDQLGLYWPKYNARYTEHIRNGYYYSESEKNTIRCTNFDFENWLSLYNGQLKYEYEYERFCNEIV